MEALASLFRSDPTPMELGVLLSLWRPWPQPSLFLPLADRFRPSAPEVDALRDSRTESESLGPGKVVALRKLFPPEEVPAPPRSPPGCPMGVEAVVAVVGAMASLGVREAVLSWSSLLPVLLCCGTRPCK